MAEDAVVLAARKLARPVWITLCASAVFLVIGSAPASATITEDNIGCSGSADIRDEDGKRTHIDAEDARATVPREGTVNWRGSTSEPVHNHNGEIVVDLGLGNVPIDDWGAANKKDETEKRGREKLPSILKYLPPGTYLVTGSHSGDEGECAGEIEVTLQGGPTTLWKAGGVLLALLTAVGLFSAGRPRV